MILLQSKTMKVHKDVATRTENFIVKWADSNQKFKKSKDQNVSLLDEALKIKTQLQMMIIELNMIQQSCELEGVLLAISEKKDDFSKQ